jgi:hypothetical protein
VRSSDRNPASRLPMRGRRRAAERTFAAAVFKEI